MEPVMIEASFNIFDLIVLATIGISALFSFFRGFVREFLSLGAWVGASIITLYAFPTVAGWLEPHVKDGNALIVSGIAGVGTFMVALIIISMFTSLLMKLMKSGADIGLLDNALGLVFGVLRGLLLVAIGYIMAEIVMPKDGFDDNIASAMTAPYVKKTADLLKDIAPDYLNDIDIPKQSESAEDAGDTPKIDTTDDEGTGNQWDSMDKLQRMIEEKAKDTSDQYRNQ